MKVLNLYACLGGNRYKWTDCDITAVELDHELARLYKERFPNDTVIITDAHQYLLDHYKEYDFIWSSPPCPSHSRIRHSQAKGRNNEIYKPIYPEMTLYQEIIFLDSYFDGKYCVENVIPYYDPLIKAQKRGRHLYWCNFILPYNLNERNIKGIMCGGSNDELNWYKQNPVPNFADGELAWTSFKKPAACIDYRYYGNLQGKSTVKDVKIHPTQKPIALYLWLLNNYAKQGDKIFDSHVGSGSSRIACDKLGYYFEGCEIDKDYWEAQEKRYKNYKSQLTINYDEI